MTLWQTTTRFPWARKIDLPSLTFPAFWDPSLSRYIRMKFDVHAEN